MSHLRAKPDTERQTQPPPPTPSPAPPHGLRHGPLSPRCSSRYYCRWHGWLACLFFHAAHFEINLPLEGLATSSRSTCLNILFPLASTAARRRQERLYLRTGLTRKRRPNPVNCSLRSFLSHISTAALLIFNRCVVVNKQRRTSSGVVLCSGLLIRTVSLFTRGLGHSWCFSRSGDFIGILLVLSIGVVFAAQPRCSLRHASLPFH